MSAQPAFIEMRYYFFNLIKPKMFVKIYAPQIEIYC